MAEPRVPSAPPGASRSRPKAPGRARLIPPPTRVTSPSQSLRPAKSALENTSGVRDDVLAALIEELSPVDMGRLKGMIERRMFEAALAIEDIASLMTEHMSLISASGDAPLPKFINDKTGLCVLYGSVRDTSKEKHTCILYTLLPHEKAPEEYWSWDDMQESYVDSITAKPAQVRSTVTLHVLSPGMQVTQHRMSFNPSDQPRHTRKSTTAWKVVVKGEGEEQKMVLEPITSPVLRSLPRGAHESS